MSDTNGSSATSAQKMKSTKVQNPRCVPHIKPNNARLLATHRGAAVLPGQYSLLRRLAATCIVWGKAEPAIRTILHDALNGQNYIVLA